jgi:beta-phosphoglucomutase-like phosphatase (HAD superfamily)
VIADTEGGRYESYCEILETFGYDMRSRCTLESLTGLTGSGFISMFFPEIPAAQAKEIVQLRQTHYMAHLDKFCIPYPGMKQTIRDIKEKGYYLALTTANSTDSAHHLLEATGVAQYFDAVCGCEICEDPVTRMKDYSRVPKQINKTVAECVVVEDSPVGVTGAKRAGFRCIAFERFKSEIITQSADSIVRHYNDLRKIIGLPPIKNLKNRI